MDQSIFFQLSIIIVIAAAVSLIMRSLRQPLIIGYIITGFIVSPALLGIVQDHEAFESFSETGIALLLFIIGLGLNVNVIKSTSKPVLVAFIANTIGIGMLGFGSAYLLGYNPTESLILAAALFFSSTIIVIKVLSDKKEQSRLYGQISIGILLAEDVAATIALLFVSASSGTSSAPADFILLLSKAIILGGLLAFVGGYIMPRVSKTFAASQELLFIFALGWAFGIASIFYWAGFSIEVGALFAGVSLAHLPYVQAIGTKLKPIRDFFVILFFIALGESLGLDNISSAIIPAIVLSALVLISKPFLVMSSLAWLGYTKQTSFKTAIHLSQISEFSIILVVLAQTNDLVGKNLVAIVTLTLLITIAVSTYLMKYDDELYDRFQNPLGFFERSKTKKELKTLSHYPLVLIGYSEGGYSFVETFRKMKKKYVVIDYDPDVIESLDHQHIHNLYGDVTDTELLDEIGLHKSEIVVSTLGISATNLLLAKHISEANDEAIFICHANTLDDAEMLYEAGAAYVLLPHFIGNEHINQFINRHGTNKKAFLAYRHKHLVSLGNIAVKK